MIVSILTGGGDCPGLNAVIRAVVRKGIEKYGFEILGIKNGWLGLLEPKVEKLDLRSVSGILPRGGTILGTSRTNPLKKEEDKNKLLDNLKKLSIDALIAVGGEDTLSVADKLSKMGLKVVGVPKTIDNDLSCTDYTFGFDTAISIATEALDRLHTTAEAHHRVMVVEVMGRHTGWIAVEAGLAGGADIILIPEEHFDIDNVCKLIQKRRARGKEFSIVVVAEGAKFKVKEGEESLILQDMEKDAFDHVRLGGIGAMLAREIEQRTGYETRVTVLGHIQRGGSPTAFDRILGTRFGIAAIDFVAEGKFGYMVSLQGNKIVAVELEKAVAKLKTVDMELYEISSVFFG